MTHPEFGITKKESLWNGYLGKWITIRAQGIPTTYVGKMIEIKEEYAVLSPFQDGYFDEDRGFICTINSGRSLIPLVGSSIEPTTRRSIENYCKYNNKKNSEEREKRKRK